MKTVGEIYQLRNLIKEPTCFQNPDNPTCTDVILTSRLVLKVHRDRAFWLLQNDSRAVMKMRFPKMKPQVVSYRKYKEFHNETFLGSIRHEVNVPGQFLN